MQGADLGCDPTGLLTFDVQMNPAQFVKPVDPYKGVVLYEIAPVVLENFQQILDRAQERPRRPVGGGSERRAADI